LFENLNCMTRLKMYFHIHIWNSMKIDFNKTYVQTSRRSRVRFSNKVYNIFDVRNYVFFLFWKETNCTNVIRVYIYIYIYCVFDIKQEIKNSTIVNRWKVEEKKILRFSHCTATTYSKVHRDIYFLRNWNQWVFFYFRYIFAGRPPPAEVLLSRATRWV